MAEHSEAFRIFLEEANEHLEVLEHELLSFAGETGELPISETMNTVFRAAHSLKGSSAIAGLADLAKVAHEMEDVLDALRSEEFAPTAGIVDTLLEGVDICLALLQAEAKSTEPPSFEKLVTALHALVADRVREEPMEEISIDGFSECQTFDIQFQPLPLEDPSAVDFGAQLAALKSHGFVAGFRDCAASGDTSSAPAPHWFLRLQTFSSEEEVRQAAEPYASDIELRITVVADDPETKLSAASETAEQESPTAHESKAEATPPETTALASAREKPRDAPKSARGDSGISSTLRVDVRRIDNLMNMVGELVTAQANVEHLVQRFQAEDLGQLVEAVEDMARSTRILQEGVLAIRMVPLESSLRRFPRMVRDLARQLDKRVSLQITGQDTEIDKSVAEKLLDPLSHIVRNSLDHGLEEPEEREASGKDRDGSLGIHASHVGGEVIIEVVDDGRGIDLERLRAKAEKVGLISPDDSVSAEDLTQLIFHPGLSTAEQITAVSGRGVGMDVVRTNVENLGGTISIRSERNVGTSVRIALPLTLAVIEGLVVREYGQNYVVPLANVVESVRLSQVQSRPVSGGADVCIVRDVTTPIVRLGEILNSAEEAGRDAMAHRDDDAALLDREHDVLLVVDLGGECLAIQVDEIVDQRQLLVKNLQDNFRRVPGLIGATVMSDGTVAMIIDVVGVGALARSVRRSGLAA